MNETEEKLKQAYDLIWRMWAQYPYENEFHPEIENHPAFKEARQQDSYRSLAFLDRVSRRVFRQHRIDYDTSKESR